MAEAIACTEPPRYESQLRRKGASLNVAADAINDAGEVDNLVKEMEEHMEQEEAKMEKAAAKRAARKTAKAKAKPTAKPKGKAKAPAAEPKEGPMDFGGKELLPPGTDDELEDDAEEAAALDAELKNADCMESAVPYPEDAYEPPPHINGNHVYSNCYKRAMVKGATKEVAADAARIQSLIFRTHAVVSKNMVGTFRAPKGSKAAPKKKK